MIRKLWHRARCFIGWHKWNDWIDAQSITLGLVKLRFCKWCRVPDVKEMAR